MKKISLALLATSILAFGHGSVTPQAVDTKELRQVGEKLLCGFKNNLDSYGMT